MLSIFCDSSSISDKAPSLGSQSSTKIYGHLCVDLLICAVERGVGWGTAPSRPSRSTLNMFYNFHTKCLVYNSFIIGPHHSHFTPFLVSGACMLSRLLCTLATSVLGQVHLLLSREVQNKSVHFRNAIFIF